MKRDMDFILLLVFLTCQFILITGQHVNHEKRVLKEIHELRKEERAWHINCHTP